LSQPLPKHFVEKMERLLGQESDEFFLALQKPRSAGLRINPLKLNKDTWEEISPYSIEPIPFTKCGYYYDYEKDEPGKHPYHAAGLYYIQEPSAMFIADILDAQPGERVLDLCAAPGGKSTQIAANMKNEGLLISNEFVSKRAKILSENIERMGIKNCIVTNEAPDSLSLRFPGYFDKILVDAPCSGEGMFRKDPEAIQYWSPDLVMECQHLQESILENAYRMLKPGGILVYSTCTFSPEENEQTIEQFLENHPDMELLPIEKGNGIEDGRVGWTKNQWKDIRSCARLWPHKIKGEGHFAAKLRKRDSNSNNHVQWPKLARPLKKVPEDFQQFVKESLQGLTFSNLITIGSQLYALPDMTPDLSGIRVIRSGLHLGELKKNRFEPNHALALYLSSFQAKQTLRLDSRGKEWLAYLKGETLTGDKQKGWTLITVDGFPLGWGKASSGIVKNAYPKGLRVKGV